VVFKKKLERFAREMLNFSVWRNTPVI